MFCLLGPRAQDPWVLVHCPMRTSLSQQDGYLVLLIEDNGRGFDPDWEASRDGERGMGRMSMRERAALVGGRLDIESRAGHGTSIYVRIPQPARTHDPR